MNMTDLTASDDVESSPNRECRAELSTIFPYASAHAQVANACADCPSFHFLACHSAVFIAGIHINFVKPRHSQMLSVTIIY